MLASIETSHFHTTRRQIFASLSIPFLILARVEGEKSFFSLLRYYTGNDAELQKYPIALESILVQILITKHLYFRQTVFQD